MKKIFYGMLFILCVLAGKDGLVYSAINQQQHHLAETNEAHTYLLWDNCTPASQEDLESDPLLILRVSPRYTDHADSLPLAWQRVAQFSLNGFNEDKMSQTAHFMESAPSDNAAPRIANSTYIFDHASPAFHLDIQGSICEKIWWQISSISDFTEVTSSFDSLQTYAGTVKLSDLDETFLEPDQEYYFKVKTYSDGIWSQWSEPFPFIITKPAAVENAHIETTGHNCYELCWNGREASDTSYYVFASNSLDFIPTIYTPLQPNALLGTEIIEASASDNFLGETTVASWPVNGNFAYYRVIAQTQGRLSNPSPIIRFWENGKAPVGNILKVEPFSNLSGVDPLQIARRVALPPVHEWMQVRESDPKSASSYKYVQNPYVSEQEWKELQPYFLPENHPTKSILDHAFQKQRVLQSLSAMKKAGFKPIRKPENDMVVAEHSKMKGFLIKAYLDKIHDDERYWFQRRAAGARQVQECIDRHGYNSIMKAPQKWIYPLPPEPSPVESTRVWRKDFILVVENVEPLKNKKNKSAYKKRVTPEILNALYTVLMENLLVDSFYLPNISFCKDGRIAFLDTEFFNDDTRPMKLWKLKKYLSPDMQAYWDQLIKHGVP